MGILTPRENEKWREWTSHIPGSAFIEGSGLGVHKLVVPIGGWPVTVDITVANSRSRRVTSRVYTPYAPASKFQFRLARKVGQNILDDFTRMTGVSLVKSVETRNSGFNNQYNLKSNDEERARVLFENPRVLKFLPNRHDFIFGTGRKTPVHRHLPAGPGFLVFTVNGVIMDPRFAHQLCVLIGETMRALGDG